MELEGLCVQLMELEFFFLCVQLIELEGLFVCTAHGVRGFVCVYSSWS